MRENCVDHFPEVFTHEFGHAMGFTHVEDRTAVMGPVWKSTFNPREQYHAQLAFEVGPSRVLRLAVPAVMCHAEARAQDARRRACRHRLKMLGPSKASPTQRHNDRGQTEPPHAITPPSRDPPRGRQIADRGGSPSFLRHPRSPKRDTSLDTPGRVVVGRAVGRAPPTNAQHQHGQCFTVD